MEALVVGKFQKNAHFGFVIPEDRDDQGGDFFVHADNMKGAEDGDKVECRPLKNYKGKKPEAKIINVLNGKAAQRAASVKKIVEGIYSGGDGNFGFIDVEGQDKWFFVYGNKRNGAKDGDNVKAEIIEFKWKDEAIVIEVVSSSQEMLVGEYRDNGKFGFVLPDDNSGDIFIAGGRKNWAEDGDEVEVKIIKRGGKNPEGVIERVL
jgi:exoribonuclease R